MADQWFDEALAALKDELALITTVAVGMGQDDPESPITDLDRKYTLLNIADRFAVMSKQCKVWAARIEREKGQQ